MPETKQLARIMLVWAQCSDLNVKYGFNLFARWHHHPCLKRWCVWWRRVGI